MTTRHRTPTRIQRQRPPDRPCRPLRVVLAALGLATVVTAVYVGLGTLLRGLT